jgi:hypothetical protein
MTSLDQLARPDAVPGTPGTPAIPAPRPVVRLLPDFDALPDPVPQPWPAHPVIEEASAPPAEEDVRARAHHVLRLALEIADGRRPVVQLAGLVEPAVLRYVAAAVGRLDRPGRPLAGRRQRLPGGVTVAARPWSESAHGGGLGVRSVRVCHPAERVAEVSAVWRYRGRSRALAARFELVDGASPSNAGGTAPRAADDRPLDGGVHGGPGIAARPGRWRCTALRLG